jgi:hypothetical protein
LKCLTNLWGIRGHKVFNQRTSTHAMVKLHIVYYQGTHFPSISNEPGETEGIKRTVEFTEKRKFKKSKKYLLQQKVTRLREESRARRSGKKAAKPGGKPLKPRQK